MDVGSLMVTLGLNITDFDRKLSDAEAKGLSFTDTIKALFANADPTIDVTVNDGAASAEITSFKAEVDSLPQEKVTNWIARAVGSTQFREEIKQDQEAIDEFAASMGDITIDVNIDDADGKLKLDELKAKLDTLHDKAVSINLHDAGAKVKMADFAEKLRELRDGVVDIDLNDEDAKLKIDDIKLKLEDLRNAHAAIDIDDADAKLKIDDIAAKLFKLREDGNIEIHVHDADAMLKLDSLERKLDNIKMKSMNLGGNPATGTAAAAGGGAGFLPWLIGAGAALAPSMGAPIVGGGMGLLSSLLAGGVGTAGLATVAIPNIKGLISDQQNLKTAIDAVNAAEQKVQGAKTYQQWLVATQNLNTAQDKLRTTQDGIGASEQKALTALTAFQTFWQSFTDSFKPAVFSLLTQGLNTVQTLLTDMKPVITAAASAFTQLLGGASSALSSPFWKSFFSYLGGEAKDSIVSLGTSIGNITTGVAALMMAFDPMAKSMNKGLVDLTKRFADWASHLSSTEGFKKFLEYAKQNGPKFMDVLGQIFSLIGKLLVILAPLSSSLLSFVDYVLRLTNALLGNNSVLRQFIDFVIQVATRIVDVVNEVAKLITSLVNLGWSFKPVNDAWSAMQGLAKNVWSAIKSDTQTAIQGIQDGFTNLKTALSGAWDKIKTEVSKHAKEAWKAITDIFQNVGQWFSERWTDIQNGLSGGWDDIKSGLSTFANNAYKAVTNVFDGLSTYFSGLWTEAVTWGENLIDNIAKGIQNAIGSVKNAIGNVVKAIAGPLAHHSPAAEGPLSDDDEWMPRMMQMMIDGVKEYTPRLSATINQALNPTSLNPTGLNMPDVSGGGHTFQFINHGTIYGEEGIKKLVVGTMQDNILPVLTGKIKPTARAMGVST